MQIPYKYVLTDKDYKELANLSANIHRRSYSKFLNNVGQAYFEVYHDNELLKSIGMDPIKKMYGLKIYRGNSTTPLWQGMIDGMGPSDKTHTSMDIIGFNASSRLQDFGDVLINPTKDYPGERRGLANKKIGTQVLQPFFNECKAKSDSPISDITSSISDPIDEDKKVATMQEQDTVSIDSLLNMVVLLADVTNADFYLDDTTKVFYFKDHVGSDSTLSLRYVHGAEGNNINGYSIELNLRDVINHPIGFCTGEGENMKLVGDVYDTASKKTFKLRERWVDVRALDSEKSVRTQLKKQLSLYSKPKYYSAVSLAQTMDLFDGWKLGDTFDLWIQRGFINIRERKRIMGVTVDIDAQNVENITIHYQDIVA